MEPFKEIQVDYGPQMLWPQHCVQGEKGSELSSLLEVTGDELVVLKGLDPS